MGPLTAPQRGFGESAAERGAGHRRQRCLYGVAKMVVFASVATETPSAEFKIECLDKLLLSDLLCISSSTQPSQANW